MIEKVVRVFKDSMNTRSWWILLVILLIIYILIPNTSGYVYSFQNPSEINDWVKLTNRETAVMDVRTYLYNDVNFMYLFHPYQYIYPFSPAHRGSC